MQKADNLASSVHKAVLGECGNRGRYGRVGEETDQKEKPRSRSNLKLERAEQLEK